VRILLVDDRPENLLSIEAALEHIGPTGGGAGLVMSQPTVRLDLVRASSGPEALRKLLLYDFAVILLDVQMPGMDGYETASLIRQRGKSQATPIIFLTAINTSEANVFQGYSLGAVDYLFKPFDPKILGAKVSVFIDLYRKQQENKRMADELRVLNEDLEQRVADRTIELSETNTALLQAKELAEHANHAKDQFLAVLSHELRTPLTPVIAIVQVLLEDPKVTTETKSWVETIGRNVQLEARLIDDLLDLTRITNGKLQLHLGPVEIHTVIRETVAICSEDIRAKQLGITFELNARNTHVRADPARLQQVLWNLIKNAVKFTPQGKSITIRTENTHPDAPPPNEVDSLRCQVIDTGIGIPEEHLRRVFNAFDQGGELITKQFGGLGLGLAISKALVEQQGGSITAQSDGVQRGATFTIEFPCFAGEALSEVHNQEPVAEHAFMEVDNRSDRSDPTDQTTQIGIPGNIPSRLLLVEDNNDTSHALQVLLERKGFTVIVGRSVQSALDIAKTYPYELVISDIGLPDGDGLELIRKLKAIRSAPGIAISGFGRDEDIRRSLAAGFSAHLVKPVSFDQLYDVLQQLLVLA